MDPIQVSSVEDTTPSGGEAPDLPLTETPHEPAEAPPAAPEPPAHAQRVGEFLRTGRTGYAERQRQIREENARLKRLFEENRSGDERTNEMLRQAAELVRQRNAPQEEVPDPSIDPVGFQKWVAAQNNAALEERLKPVLDFAQKQQERMEREEQERREQEEYQERVQAESGRFRQWSAEYEREQPELSYGARDRLENGRELLTNCFAAVGYENAQLWADRLIGQIGWEAGEQGANGAAAIDAFINSLFLGVSQQLVDAGFLAAPIVPAAQAAAAASPVSGAPVSRGPRPMRTEAQRIDDLRRRNAAASSAAPSMPASEAPRQESEAVELYRAGVANEPGGMGKIRAAALRDCNGDMKQAAMLLASLR